MTPVLTICLAYWTLYNSAYVLSADALVPYYPNMDDEKMDRPDLAIVI